MKYFLKTALYLFCAAFIFTACEGQFDSLVDERLEDNPVPDNSIEAEAGQADFSNYIAIGNSLTAGYMDGALYNLGQQNSIPVLLADQLALAGGADTFNQPNINSDLGFNTTVSPNPAPSGAVLGRFKLDTNIPGPSPTIGGDPITPFSGDASALDNFGVPGILLGQLLTPATGGPQSPQNPAFNPFYARFASAPGASTILGDAVATQPTFFTLWIGNNDVLGFAASGGSNPGILTSPPAFSAQFNATINKLINNTSASGVVVNIPPLLGVPFFQAVGFDAIPLDGATAGALNQGYLQYNGGVNQAAQGGFISPEEAARRQISFSAGQNAFVIEDESLTNIPNLPNLRQAEPTDLAILPLGGILGQDQGNGPVGLQDPVGDRFVLIPQEQQQIEQTRAAFNATISSAVDSNSDRLALYNTNAPDGVFADLFGLAPGDGLGVTVDGVNLAPDFSPNGVFSTDGIHPNPRGSAAIANEIIDVIEQNFGATIPDVDVLRLPSVQICAGNCVSQQGQGEEDS
jgi:lysophospholipase L1-like esterase